MDELMQAVSDLRGDIKTKDDGGIYFVKDTYIYKRMFGGSYFAGAIATTRQFLIVVQQLSEASWINGQPVEEWLRDMKGGVEILTDKDGDQYQKWAIYEFSDDGKDWAVDALKSTVENEGYQFKAKREEWKLCREVKPLIGTITKAPLVLEDGALVMFDCGNSTGRIGEVYTSVTNLKMINFVQNNRFVEADKCTNIVKLVPESK